MGWSVVIQRAELEDHSGAQIRMAIHLVNSGYGELVDHIDTCNGKVIFPEHGHCQIINKDML